MTHLITLLADGFEEVEAVTVIDLLRRAGAAVTTIGLQKKEVRGAHGISIGADTTMKHLPRVFDGIILPGGNPGTAHLADSSEVISLVQETFTKGLVCAAICAAPTVFGKAGILTGVRATCYPGLEDGLGEARFIEAAVVRDRNVITSRGLGTAIPFALELIAMTVDMATSERIGKQILYP